MANWFSPNTYNPNFGTPPTTPGVYCIKEFDLDYALKGNKPKQTVVYVGSTTNLLQRYKNHEVLKHLNKRRGFDYAFYFKPMPVGFYDLEISLIRRLQPVINQIHKTKHANV